MARAGVERLVHFSSVSVYGDGDTDEQRADLRPTTPYGESKRQAEQVLMDWQSADPARRALRILRPCVVYGPGHHGNLRRWMRELDRSRPWRIGDGRQVKSVAYVGNVVAATLFDLATRAGVVVHNVVDGPDLRVVELERLILDALGRGHVRPRVVPPAVALAVATLFDLHAAATGARHAISRARVRKYCTGTPVRQGVLYRSGFVAPHDHRAGLTVTIAAETDRAR
jgi:nucleoside-diphosphate-sugar epimerase